MLKIHPKFGQNVHTFWAEVPVAQEVYQIFGFLGTPLWPFFASAGR
jgi:hypothetical protein